MYEYLAILTVPIYKLPFEKLYIASKSILLEDTTLAKCFGFEELRSIVGV